MGASIVAFAIVLVFLGCSSNVVFLELMIKENPGSGNIITFFQFAFIALEGGLFVTRFGLAQSNIPIRRYFVLVSLFFLVSVINNYALNFDIPLPLHMIFRSGSLMANMVLGVILLKKRYSKIKYLAIMMITAGIVMATMASAQQMNDAGKQTAEGYQRFAQLTIGVTLLLTALFASARMGIYQEVLYREYGKHPREAMFYLHALPLPGFLVLASDIWNKCIIFNNSVPVIISGYSIPKMWLYLLGNGITQYVCIRGVFILTSECPSLVVTLVITLRKFVSLLFSIYYFNNPFTYLHWVATAMVFSGTAIFTGLLTCLYNRRPSGVKND